MPSPLIRWRGRAGWLVLAVVLLAACGGSPQRATTTTTALPVRLGNLTQTVSSSGQIQAQRESFLNFATSGTIASILVNEGQRVKAGDKLAVLDAADLDQQVLQAQANLKSAQASLADLRDGPSETDLRTSQSQLEVAKLQLEQASKGDASAAEIASARASLKSAQASLAALKTPTDASRQAAEQAVSDAQRSLQSSRDSASANKTSAELSLQKAVDALTQAQSRYATAKQDWEYVQATGQNPSNPETTNAQGQVVKNKVSDTQRQQYYDTYVQAEAAKSSAEAGVSQAQVAYDNARQQEVAQVQQAESQLATAQRQLTTLLNPTAKDMAQAEAQVAQAQAQLASLTSGGTANSVAIAQQTVEQRQAALDALRAPPSDAQLAQSEAQVAQAEASLAAAQSNRAAAELVAPFDGTVATVNITIGESVSANGSGNTTADTAAVYLIDDSAYYVSLSISEVDLGKVALDQPARVTIDALPGQLLNGTLSYIATTPTVSQNVTTYAARIALTQTQAPLRVGLSAAVAIVTAQANNVLLVPNIALQTTRNGTEVLLQNGDQSVPTQIETGLVGESQTEVRSGLKEGDLVLVTVQGSANSTTRIPGGGGIFPAGGPPGGGGGGQRPGGN